MKAHRAITSPFQTSPPRDTLTIGFPMLFRYRKAMRTFLNEITKSPASPESEAARQAFCSVMAASWFQPSREKLVICSPRKICYRIAIARSELAQRLSLSIFSASSDDDHIVGGCCLTAASPQYSNHPWSARFLLSVKGG
jgi:hypothetical protein